jgi:primosomal protein N' (replication factor Y)
LSSEYPSLLTYQHLKKKECKLIDSETYKQEIKIIGVNRVSTTLNPIFVELVRKNIASGKRIAVIFNKTGYASRLVCSACGHVFKCEHCSSSLRLSAVSNKGFCPYCTKTYTIPSNCPYCHQGHIKSSGTGVQKLNVLLKATFPELTIADWENRSRATHITIATSKILSCLYGCERFDVGFLLDIDSFFWRLDYDATFNAFIYAQKLSTFFQEAFYIFTENPTHYIFTLLNCPWQQFYEKEFAFRKELLLPPFGMVVTITLRAANENRLLKRAETLYNRLKEKNLKVYGPLKEQPFKLRNNFRYSLILKLPKGHRWHKKIKDAIRNLRDSQIKLAVSIR